MMTSKPIPTVVSFAMLHVEPKKERAREAGAGTVYVSESAAKSVNGHRDYGGHGPTNAIADIMMMTAVIGTAMTGA